MGMRLKGADEYVQSCPLQPHIHAVPALTSLFYYLKIYDKLVLYSLTYSKLFINPCLQLMRNAHRIIIILHNSFHICDKA